MDHKTLSKYLSLLLRHKPELLGLNMDENGWVKTQEIIDKSPKRITMHEIVDVVDNNDKQRFAFKDNRNYIRANQGHSIRVNMGFIDREPPVFLYHGTAERFLDDIRKNGLNPMSRQYVHLSEDFYTAINVGTRHGKVVVLTVKAFDMWSFANKKFYKSENGVWLTKHVPWCFIDEDIRRM